MIASFVLILILVGFIYIQTADQEQKETSEPVYQGVVPEGYDLEHFRKTGITRPKPLTNLSTP